MPFADDVDQLAKGSIDAGTAEERRAGSPTSRSTGSSGWSSAGWSSHVFNTTLFTTGDSRSPELAGIWGALVGSFWTLLVTLLLSFPLGVGAAIYLEEFAPKNRWTDLIEVNINNLAAVPSIVFGLLGLAVFLNFFGLPRSAPLVGGLVLALMTLPIIIIASRAALKAVPPSIREAALGRRCLEDADGVPPRRAAGDARHADRRHPRHGARARRDGAAADDRHGRLHRRHPGRPTRSGDGAAGADLPVGGRAGARLRRARPRRRSSSCSAFLIVMNLIAVLLRKTLRAQMVGTRRHGQHRNARESTGHEDEPDENDRCSQLTPPASADDGANDIVEDSRPATSTSSTATSRR